MISEQLMSAYMSTEYRVLVGAETLVMRIDRRNEEVGNLLRSAGVESAAFVTAWNPRSTLVSKEENERAQEGLIKELEAEGYRWWPGVGIDPVTGHGEDSLLVLGIGAEQADALARAFGQDAIVFVGRECIPRLRLIDQEPL